MPDETLNLDEISRLIDACRRRAFDFRVPAPERAEAAQLSNALTQRAVRLVGAEFSARGEEIKAANETLARVSAKLADAMNDVTKLRATFEDIGKVAKTLDELLGHLA